MHEGDQSLVGLTFDLVAVCRADRSILPHVLVCNPSQCDNQPVCLIQLCHYNAQPP